jgi:hypothetical protein
MLKLDGTSTQPITHTDLIAFNANYRINRAAIAPFIVSAEVQNGSGIPKVERQVDYLEIFDNIKELEPETGTTEKAKVLYVSNMQEFDEIENGIIGFPTLDEKGNISELELLRLRYLTDEYIKQGYITDADLVQFGNERLYADIHTLLGHQIPILVKRRGKLVGGFRFITPNLTNRAIYGIDGQNLLQVGELPVHEYIKDEIRRQYGREEGLYWKYNPSTKEYKDMSKKGRIALVGEISQFINIDSKVAITLYMIEFLKKLGEVIRKTEIGERLKALNNRPGFSVLVSPDLAKFMFNVGTSSYATANNAELFQIDESGDAPGSPVTPGMIVFNL